MVKDMSPESKNLDYKQKLIRSFGRTKSRKLSNNKNFLLENFYDSYKISNIDESFSKNFLELNSWISNCIKQYAEKPIKFLEGWFNIY